MSWTPDRLERLRRLWNDEGKTASEIAAILGGVSRNAVMAKARRMGLNTRPDTAPFTHNVPARFDRLVDQIVDAPINRPCSVAEAARRVGMRRVAAEAMWAALCVRYGETFSLGTDFRPVKS